MAPLPKFLRRHTVTIKPLTGEGPYGPVHGAAVNVRGLVDEGRRLVRNEQGTEVTSEATVYLPLDTECPAGSLVRLPSDREATVITAKRRDGAGLPTPDHLEVALT